MANKKITDLTLATTPLGGTEEIELVQGGVSKRVAVSEVSGGSGVQTVTGTTVDNTDPLNPIVNVPTLQQVTDVVPDGNVTTNYIEINNGSNSTIVDAGSITYEDIGIKSRGDNSSEIGFNEGLNSIRLKRPLVLSQSTNEIFLKEAMFPSIDETISYDSSIITTNTTAKNDFKFSANGTITVTDPTPVTNKGYIVHVISGTSTIGGVGYTAGALVYRFYDGSVWVSKNYNTPIDAIPTDGSTNAVESNGVFDALALKKTVYYENTTPSTAVTGTTAETQISGANFTILANTINANSHLFILPTIYKTVATNTTQVRLKFNTTNNYAGATTIANFATSGTNTYGGGHRKLSINGGNIKGLSFTSAIIQDFISSGSGVSSTSFPVTGDLYFFWSIQNNAVGDSSTLENVQITS